MHRRWMGCVLLFVLFVSWFGGSGCFGKDRRVCESDVDCAGSAPNIYCDMDGFCNVRQCSPGIKRPCYSGEKGCKREAAGGTYTCQGSCKAGIQICEVFGLWSTCLGEQLPTLEICDLADNDCDGQIDNVEGGIATCQCLDKGKERPCFAGHAASLGVAECRAGVQVCTDQNRWGTCRDQILPSIEVCDGRDNDCNGKVDDTPNGCLCADGDTRACYIGPVGTLANGRCKAGVQSCKNNRWDSACLNQVLPAKKDDCSTPQDETCGLAPNVGCGCTQGETDCAGTCVDTVSDSKHCGACGKACIAGEICKNSVCACTNGQACCKPGEQKECYSGPSNTRDVSPCKVGKATCTTNGIWGACMGEVTPQTEICNGLDDDCDGQIDKLTRPCAQQQGVCAGSIESCVGGTFVGCAGTPSFGAVYEGVERTCDGRDNDCDGKIDNAPDGSDLCRKCIPTTRDDALSVGSMDANADVRFAFRWDGLQFASVDSKRVLRFFFVGNSTPFPILNNLGIAATPLLSWNPVGAEIALAMQDESILLLSTRSYQPLLFLKQTNQGYAHKGGIERLAWSPDGKLLASAGGASDEYKIRVWDAKTGAERFVLFDLAAKATSISGLAFDRTSRQLVSTSIDGRIRVWGMSDGKQTQSTSVSKLIYALAIHPAKDEIAIACGSAAQNHSQIVIYSLGKLSDPPKDPRQQTIAKVTQLAYNRDGRLLAAIDAFPSVNLRIWETKDYEVVSILYSDAYAFWHFAWNPTKDELITASQGNPAYLYFSCPNLCDQFALKSQNAFYSKSNPVKGLGMTANQDFLVWWTANGALHRAGPPQDLASVKSSISSLSALSTFSVYPSLHPSPKTPNSLLLLYGTTDRKVASVQGPSFGTQQSASTTNPHAAPISAVAWSPHTGLPHLLSADTSGVINAWYYFTSQGWGRDNQWTEHTGAAVNGLAFAPDGYKFASVSDDGTIRIRDLGDFSFSTITLKDGNDSNPHGGVVNAVAWSRDGNWLATAGTNLTTHTIKIWDVRNNFNLLKTLPVGAGVGHTSIIRSLVFHPEGHLLASGGDDKDIRIWKVSSIDPPTVLGWDQGGHTEGVNALVWSPDGKSLYSGGGDGRVIHWECR